MVATGWGLAASDLTVARSKVPLIGVTGPVHGGRTAWLFTRQALRLAGAHSQRITASSRALSRPLDGLVIGGGDDIDPARYGEAPRLAIKLDPERDELEWRMLGQAVAAGLPVLGICRGSQLINVFHGGTLHQDLTELIAGRVLRRTLLPRKRIVIEPASRLAAIMGTTETLANSLHHQAVKQLAPGFRISAYDSDGVIQAFEGKAGLFCLGVQWHPEYLPQRRAQRRIFRALVAAARAGGAWSL